VADKNTANRIFAMHNVRCDPLRIDIPKGKRSITNLNTRFWSVLSFEDSLSDEAYVSKLLQQEQVPPTLPLP